MGHYAAHEGALDATGMRFGIVVARVNRDITQPLLAGADVALQKHDAAEVNVAWVPGAFEIPLVAKRMAESGSVDAVICLGAVIRGETAHFEYVAGEAAAGITRAALDTGVPVIFGVLTVDDREQARDRLGGEGGHKGGEGPPTAIEMGVLVRAPPGPAPR